MSKRIANESDSEPRQTNFLVEFEHGVVKNSAGVFASRKWISKSPPFKKPEKFHRIKRKDKNADIVENEDVLLQTALQKYFSEHEIEMKKFYLSQDEVREVLPTDEINQNQT